jgi:hypothetical protein
MEYLVAAAHGDSWRDLSYALNFGPQNSTAYDRPRWLKIKAQQIEFAEVFINLISAGLKVAEMQNIKTYNRLEAGSYL